MNELAVHQYCICSVQLTVRQYCICSVQLAVHQYSICSVQLTVHQYSICSVQLAVHQYCICSVQLAVHQYCTCLVSDCSKMQLSMEFVAWKDLTSSANNRYLQHLITLQRSLVNILKLKVLQQVRVGLPKNFKSKETLSIMHTEECRLESNTKPV